MKLLIIFFCFIIIIVGLLEVNTPPKIETSETKNSGVIVHGWESDGWIENTNDFPVRIKEVWIYRGETTVWINIFLPNQKIEQFISQQHGFHIYTLDGIEIGWIQPIRNGK